MRVELLQEPELQFGRQGRHVDIRFGIKNHGPLVLGDPLAPSEIRVGLIGTPHTIQGVKDWLTLCRGGIRARASPKPHLFPEFPGFDKDSPFACDCIVTEKLERPINPRQLNELLQDHTREDAATKAVELFIGECLFLQDKAPVDVFVCAPPAELMEFLDTGLVVEDANDGIGDDDAQAEDGAVDSDEEDTGHARRIDFHDLLKARGLSLRKPIQMVRASTYDETAKSAVRDGEKRKVQDTATRAWNFHTALYYKAGGIPWRLVRNLESETCFIGVSFFRSLDGSRTQTSVAQVFNERGEGVILRGGDAEPISKDPKEDRQAHLSKENMHSLIKMVLATYHSEHKHFPPRVVIHKTSSFNKAERDGCHCALDDLKIDGRDLLVVTRSFTRLFRVGQYPPLRGTLAELDSKHHLLYTRGSTDFYMVYPGLYVPRPLEFFCEDTQTTPRKLGEEILALTKLNWNNTQFDCRDPITIRAARQVGDIVKHLDREARLQTSYAYYM
jgi:hypothetical protein